MCCTWLDFNRKQEKSNNEKRLRDAFSLMNDILTAKPSAVHHKPSCKPGDSNGMLKLLYNKNVGGINFGNLRDICI